MGIQYSLIMGGFCWCESPPPAIEAGGKHMEYYAVCVLVVFHTPPGETKRWAAMASAVNQKPSLPQLLLINSRLVHISVGKNITLNLAYVSAWHSAGEKFTQLHRHITSCNLDAFMYLLRDLPACAVYTIINVRFATVAVYCVWLGVWRFVFFAFLFHA